MGYGAKTKAPRRLTDPNLATLALLSFRQLTRDMHPRRAGAS
jgi:hypothetical protein